MWQEPALSKPTEVGEKVELSKFGSRGTWQSAVLSEVQIQKLPWVVSKRDELRMTSSFFPIITRYSVIALAGYNQDWDLLC